jgi:hypothetical protein
MVLIPAVRGDADWKKDMSTLDRKGSFPRVSGFAYSKAKIPTAPVDKSTAVEISTVLEKRESFFRDLFV